MLPIFFYPFTFNQLKWCIGAHILCFFYDFVWFWSFPVLFARFFKNWLYIQKMTFYILHIFINLRSSTFHPYQNVSNLTSLEVARDHQRSFIKPRHFIPFWKAVRVRMKDLGCQRVSEGVQGCQSSLSKFFVMYPFINSQLA